MKRAITTGPDAGDFTWNYQISVDANEQLNAASPTPCSSAATCGAFFTIYDFNGYVSGSIMAPTGWTPQVQLTGLTNSTENPADSGSVINLSFVYTGTLRAQSTT